MVKHNDLKYWVEKYILQNINDIDNIDKLKIKNNRNNLDLIDITDSEIFYFKIQIVKYNDILIKPLTKCLII